MCRQVCGRRRSVWELVSRLRLQVWTSIKGGELSMGTGVEGNVCSGADMETGVENAGVSPTQLAVEHFLN